MTTTRQSFIPLSPSSRPTSPLYTQRSAIRVNTTLLVRRDSILANHIKPIAHPL